MGKMLIFFRTIRSKNLLYIFAINTLLILALSSGVSLLSFSSSLLLMGYIPGHIIFFKLLRDRNKLEYFLVTTITGIFVSWFILNFIFIFNYGEFYYFYFIIVLFIFDVFLYRYKFVISKKDIFHYFIYDNYSKLIIFITIFLIAIFLPKNISLYEDTISFPYRTYDKIYMVFLHYTSFFNRDASNLLLNSQIHYFGEFLMFIISKLSGLSGIKTFNYLNSTANIVSPLLLVFCLKEYLQISKINWTNSFIFIFSILIFTFDIGITAGIITLLSDFELDYYLFNYASTGVFSYTNNFPTLMTKLIIYPFIYFIIIVINQDTKDKMNKFGRYHIVLAILIACSLKIKPNIFSLLFVLLLSTCILIFIKRGNYKNIAITIFLSGCFSIYYFYCLFQFEAQKQKILFMPLYYFESSKEIVLSYLHLDSLFSGAFLNFIIFIFLMSSFIFIIPSLIIGLKKWFKYDCIYLSIAMACFSSVIATFLFIIQTHRLGNILWFYFAGFYFLPFLIGVIVYDNYAKKRTISSLYNLVIISSLSVSILVGVNGFYTLEKNLGKKYTTQEFSKQIVAHQNKREFRQNLGILSDEDFDRLYYDNKK